MDQRASHNASTDQASPDPIRDALADDAFRAEQAEAAARARRQMQQLESLAALALDTIELIHERARAPISEENDAALERLTGGDVGLTLWRLGRMIRLTQVLENKIDEERRARRSMDRAAQDQFFAERAEAAQAAEDLRKERLGGQIETCVEQIIEKSAKTGETEPLKERLYERLSEDEYYFEVGEMPTIELIARLCQQLDLPFDATDWSAEPWAGPEPASQGLRRSEPHIVAARLGISLDPPGPPPGKPRGPP